MKKDHNDIFFLKITTIPSSRAIEILGTFNGFGMKITMGHWGLFKNTMRLSLLKENVGIWYKQKVIQAN